MSDAILKLIASAGKFTRNIFSAATTGSWEGHERDRFRNRPIVRLTGENTDLNFGVRDEMISEARRLCQCFPIAKRIIRQYSNYCVGNLRIKWNTGDRAMDKQYGDYWLNWMNRADVRGTHRFPMLMKIAVRSMIRDGDVLFQKVKVGTQCQVQLIEGDRVTNAPNGGILNIDTDDCTGGVIHDVQGRRSAYRIAQRNRWGYFVNPKDYPAQDFLHFWDTDRVDAFRGVTQFHVALNALADLKEIIDAEKIGVKNNSRLSMLVKTVTGQARARTLTQDASLATPDGKIVVQSIEQGLNAYMFPGEDIKAHESNRPGAAWEGFVEWLVRLIAIGLDLPFGVVWSMVGLGGVGARLEVRQAERTFGHIQDLMEAQVIEPLAAWVIPNAVANRELPLTTNWFNFEVRRPAGISVDIGHDTNAAMAEIRMGVLSSGKYAGENGDDIYDVADEEIAYVKYVKDQCAKDGIDPNQIRNTAIGGQAPSAQSGASQENRGGKSADGGSFDNEEGQSQDQKPARRGAVGALN